MAKFVGENIGADEVTGHPRQPPTEETGCPQEVASSSETTTLTPHGQQRTPARTASPPAALTTV